MHVIIIIIICTLLVLFVILKTLNKLSGKLSNFVCTSFKGKKNY